MSENIKGLVFNIIHGSFVDGYGIRTTIFLKGCPLKCLWCCNPEGQSYSPELKVSYDRCNGCARCLDVCHASALTLKDGIVVVDRDRCDVCMKCTDVCYTDALDRFGVLYTVDEMFDIVKRDASYYSTSGGGLTIGGGEPTGQADFTLGLIKKCADNGINVALDTCGYVTDPKGLGALKAADLLLFDIKGLDAAGHLRNTKASNDVILGNLRMLNDMNKKIIIRLPMIPGYTDSEENLKATAELLQSLKSVERVDIIFAHYYGMVKYDQIGLPYELESEEIAEDRQGEIVRFFESYGLNVQNGG